MQEMLPTKTEAQKKIRDRKTVKQCDATHLEYLVTFDLVNESGICLAIPYTKEHVNEMIDVYDFSKNETDMATINAARNLLKIPNEDIVSVDIKSRWVRLKN
jgi:hypothetical protein